MPGHDYLEFVHLPRYRRSAEGLIDEDGQREIEATLIANPEAGPLMVGTGGVRKLRIPLEGRGKRGGARLIYYYRETKGRIYLIVAYAKGRKENLTPAERAIMKRLTVAIEGEP
jgi:hypothetical protein